MQMEVLFNLSPEKPKNMTAFSLGTQVSFPGAKAPDKPRVQEILKAHQLPASREESSGVSSEPNLDVFSAIFCSDHDVLTEVVKLPGGSKARLMCDKHPAGPLNVPDPANYKDTKYALSLILRELNRVCLVVDEAPPKIQFRPKIFQNLEMEEVDTRTLLEPPRPPLLPHTAPPPASPDPPQPPPPDLEDKVNLPSKVRKLEERDVAPLLSPLHPTSENNQRTHSDLFDFFMRDFPCDTDYVEIEDVVNPTTEMKRHLHEICVSSEIQHSKPWAPDERPATKISPLLQPPQPPELDLHDVGNQGEVNPRVSPRSDCFGLPTLFAISVLCAPDVIKTLLSANNISLFMPAPPPLTLEEDHHVRDKLRLEPPQEPTVVVFDQVNRGEVEKDRNYNSLQETALLFFPALTFQDRKETVEAEGNFSRRCSRSLSSSSGIRSLHGKPPPSSAVMKLLQILTLSPPPEPSSECSDRINRPSRPKPPKSHTLLMNHPPYIEVNIPRRAAAEEPLVVQKLSFELKSPQPPCLDLPDSANKQQRPRQFVKQVSPSVDFFFTPPVHSSNPPTPRFALEPPQEVVAEVEDIVNPGSKLRLLSEIPDIVVSLSTPVVVNETPRPDISIQTPLVPLIESTDTINLGSKISKVWCDKDFSLDLAPLLLGTISTNDIPPVKLEPPQAPETMVDDVANLAIVKVKQLEEIMIGVVWAQHNQGFDEVARFDFSDRLPLQYPTIELEDKELPHSKSIKERLDKEPEIFDSHLTLPHSISDRKVQRPAFLVKQQVPLLESDYESKIEEETKSTFNSKVWLQEESVCGLEYSPPLLLTDDRRDKVLTFLFLQEAPPIDDDKEGLIQSQSKEVLDKTLSSKCSGWEGKEATPPCLNVTQAEASCADKNEIKTSVDYQLRNLSTIRNNKVKLFEDPICKEDIGFANIFFERPHDILLDTSTFLPWQLGDPFTEKLQQKENETDAKNFSEEEDKCKEDKSEEDKCEGDVKQKAAPGIGDGSRDKKDQLLPLCVAVNNNFCNESSGNININFENGITSRGQENTSKETNMILKDQNLPEEASLGEPDRRTQKPEIVADDLDVDVDLDVDRQVGATCTSCIATPVEIRSIIGGDHDLVKLASKDNHAGVKPIRNKSCSDTSSDSLVSRQNGKVIEVDVSKGQNIANNICANRDEKLLTETCTLNNCSRSQDVQTRDCFIDCQQKVPPEDNLELIESFDSNGGTRTLTEHKASDVLQPVVDTARLSKRANFKTKAQDADPLQSKTHVASRGEKVRTEPANENIPDIEFSQRFFSERSSIKDLKTHAEYLTVMRRHQGGEMSEGRELQFSTGQTSTDQKERPESVPSNLEMEEILRHQNSSSVEDLTLQAHKMGAVAGKQDEEIQGGRDVDKSQPFREKMVGKESKGCAFDVELPPRLLSSRGSMKALKTHAEYVAAVRRREEKEIGGGREFGESGEIRGGREIDLTIGEPYTERRLRMKSGGGVLELELPSRLLVDQQFKEEEGAQSEDKTEKSRQKDKKTNEGGKYERSKSQHNIESKEAENRNKDLKEEQGSNSASSSTNPAPRPPSTESPLPVPNLENLDNLDNLGNVTIPAFSSRFLRHQKIAELDEDQAKIENNNVYLKRRSIAQLDGLTTMRTRGGRMHNLRSGSLSLSENGPTPAEDENIASHRRSRDLFDDVNFARRSIFK